MCNNRTKSPKVGEIYLVDFEGHGNEQQGSRPALIVSNNTGNMYSPNIIVLPLTSSIKKTHLPTHVVIKAEDSGLRRDSMVLCENPRCISKEKLGNYITTLSEELIADVVKGFLLATVAISYISFECLHEIWHKAGALNNVGG